MYAVVIQKILQVKYDPDLLTEGQLIEVVEDAGFDASIKLSTSGPQQDKVVHPA